MTWWEILIVAWLGAILLCTLAMRVWIGRERRAIKRVRDDLALRRLDREASWDWPERHG